MRLFLTNRSRNRSFSARSPREWAMGTWARAEKRTRVQAKQTAIPSIELKEYFLTEAELTEYVSVHSGIRIGPKRTQLPSIPCILIPEYSQNKSTL